MKLKNTDSFNLLAQLIITGGAGVDPNSCVITDLDIYLEKGCTLEQIKQCELITDMDSLMEAIRCLQVQNTHQKYVVKKLYKMFNEIFQRWISGTLNNSSLNAWIDSQVKNEIKKRWMEVDIRLNNTEKNDVIIKRMINHIHSEIPRQVTSYMDNSSDLSSEYHDLDQIIIDRISCLHEKNECSREIENHIKKYSKNEFIRILKDNSDLTSEAHLMLEEQLCNQWIDVIRINARYLRNIPCLDEYCWKLAVEYAGNSCIRIMDNNLKRAFREIISQWKQDKLPDNFQLNEDIKYFIKGFFDRETVNIPIAYDYCVSLVIDNAVRAREAVFVECMQGLATAYIANHIQAHCHDEKSSLYQYLMLLVQEMLVQGKYEGDVNIQSELQKIINCCIKQPLLQVVGNHQEIVRSTETSGFVQEKLISQFFVKLRKEQPQEGSEDQVSSECFDEVLEGRYK